MASATAMMTHILSAPPQQERHMSFAPSSAPPCANVPAGAAPGTANSPAAPAAFARRGTALRDFFFAANGASLRRAFEALALPDAPPLPPVAAWDEEEYLFNRLFVGPGPVAVPPYASVYLEPERRLMGEATLFAREAYAALGLASPWQGSVPDDHIGLELDAALAVFDALRQGRTDVSPTGTPRPAAEDLAAWWDAFVAGHMAAWVPSFLDALRRAGATSAVMGRAGDDLARWLADAAPLGRGAFSLPAQPATKRGAV
ncbi:cytoplasmic chaperone TorD family protein [Desulfovibrio sp. A2]|nr:cytoplasmic chaperone TorD family protein [Desulfovibrio sp. A2]